MSILINSHPFFTVSLNALYAAEKIIADAFNNNAAFHGAAFHKDEYMEVMAELLDVPPFSCKYGDGKIFNGSKRKFETYFSEYAQTPLFTKKGLPQDKNERAWKRALNRLRAEICKTQEQMVTIVNNVLALEKSHKKTIDGDEKLVKNKKRETVFSMHRRVRISGGEAHEIYDIENIVQLLECEVVHMALNNVMVNLCDNCNHFFITNDRRRNYCNRMQDNGKTCVDIGSNRKFRREKNSDLMYKAQRKAFSKQRMRFMRENRDDVRTLRDKITEKELDFWYQQAKMKRLAKSNDFYNWLDLSIEEIKAEYEKSNV